MPESTELWYGKICKAISKQWKHKPAYISVPFNNCLLRLPLTVVWITAAVNNLFFLFHFKRKWGSTFPVSCQALFSLKIITFFKIPKAQDKGIIKG